MNQLKTPPADERRVCERCMRPFRCPLAQPERVICGPCTPIGPRFAFVESAPAHALPQADHQAEHKQEAP